jgi:hypothetical protein
MDTVKLVRCCMLPMKPQDDLKVLGSVCVMRYMGRGGGHRGVSMLLGVPATVSHITADL